MQWTSHSSMLRAGELRSLTAGAFHLDAKEPTVKIAAAYAKNRREDTLPLRHVTAEALRPFLAGKMPGAKVFRLPERERVAQMMRDDLEYAPEAWLKAASSDEERLEMSKTRFLSYRDDSGRVADFHALRHTFISNLAAGGVHPKTAQALARQLQHYVDDGPVHPCPRCRPC